MQDLNNPERFLLRQLASLEADLDRYGRLIDALRLAFMRENNCSDIDAELLLLADASAKQIRRQQASARRAWLSFTRALEKHRKAHPAPEPGENDTVAPPTQPPAPQPMPPAAPPAPRPQPDPAPRL